MANLTRDDVLKLARLAGLSLNADEVAQYLRELNAILEYVDLLKTVDVSDLLPTSQVTGLTNIMRKDQVIDYGYTPRALLENVPEVKANQIKVKRMIG